MRRIMYEAQQPVVTSVVWRAFRRVNTEALWERDIRTTFVGLVPPLHDVAGLNTQLLSCKACTAASICEGSHFSRMCLSCSSSSSRL